MRPSPTGVRRGFPVLRPIVSRSAYPGGAMPIANKNLIGGLRKYFAADEQSDVSFARAHKCFFTDCTAVLACICQLLALTLVGVTLFPANEAHSFIIIDVLRTIDDGNHFLLGTNGLTGTGVLDNFFEVALRRIPITPDLDPNFVVGHNKLLYGKSWP